MAVVPAEDDAPVLIAERDGLFKKFGLDVRIDPVQQSVQAFPALARGTDQVIFANYVTMFQAQDKHAFDVRLIAEGSLTQPWSMAVLALKSSGILTAHDLVGKRVGILVPGNFQEITLRRTVSANNANPSTIKFVAIPLPASGVALQRHQVDAVYVGEPFVTAVQSVVKDTTKVVDPTGPPFSPWPVSGYFATRAWTDTHSRQMTAFHEAISAAAQRADTNRKEVEAVLSDKRLGGVSSSVATLVTLPEYPTSISLTRLGAVVTLAQQDHVLSSGFDLKAMVPPSLTGKE